MIRFPNRCNRAGDECALLFATRSGRKQVPDAAAEIGPRGKRVHVERGGDRAGENSR